MNRTIAALALAAILAACGGGDSGDMCAQGRPLYGDLQREYDAQCPNGPEDAGK